MAAVRYPLPEGVWPDAVALRQALAQGAISARAALESCFAAIDQANGLLNAAVYRDRAGARAAADACNAEASPTGPLHGVPVTVKECFDWRGHPATWGDPARADAIAAGDTAVAAALKRAGAAILDKTNIPPYLSDWETANPLFGATRNSYDTERSAGGSSSGSVAAVAYSALSGKVGGAAVSTASLQIALLPDLPGCSIDDSYRAAIEMFACRLRSAGTEIVETAPEIDFTRAAELMNLLQRAETVRKAELVAEFRIRQRGDALQGAYAGLNARCNDLSHRDWLVLHEERLHLCQTLETFFADYDLVLCPAAAEAFGRLQCDK